MSIKWIRRRAHMRRLPSGQRVEVASSWMPIERSDSGGPEKSCHSACPVCDAPILSQRMPNGGWVHYERHRNFSRIKHPCFYRGDDMAPERDTQTGDLFA